MALGFEEEGLFRKAGDEKALVRLKQLTETSMFYSQDKFLLIITLHTDPISFAFESILGEIYSHKA